MICLEVVSYTHLYRYELLLKSGDKINDEKYFFDRTLGYTTSEAGVLECVLSINKELKMA